jgi:hypothetical protein
MQLRWIHIFIEVGPFPIGFVSWSKRVKVYTMILIRFVFQWKELK